MSDHDGETSAGQGGGAALPRPKRPTIIRAAARVAPAEPPPRPASRPNNVISPNSSQKGDLPGKKKLEITVIDAKPISELGFRDMKGSAAHVPASLPVCNSESTGGTSVQHTQLRSHPEEDQVLSQGGDRVQDPQQGGSILQKPSAPPKSMKPTIIRPSSRVQPATGEDKLSPAPPPRPASSPHTDPSLQKSTSKQGNHNLQQPPQAQVSLLESANAPSSQNHPPAQPPVSQQAPKRPPRGPSSGLPKQKSTASIQDTKLEASTETQSQETLVQNKIHDIESPKPEPALKKPKPVPKPRPVSMRSTGFTDHVTSENSVNRDTNSKTFPPEMSIQSPETQEEISSQNSKWSSVTYDEKTAKNERLSQAPVPLKKPPRLTDSTPSSVANDENTAKDKRLSLAPFPLEKPPRLTDSTPSSVANDENTAKDKRLSLAPVPLEKPPRLTDSTPSSVANDEKTATDERLSLAPVPLEKPPRLTDSRPETVSRTDVPVKTVRPDSIAVFGQKNTPREQLPPVHKMPSAVSPLPQLAGSKPSPVTARRPETSPGPNSHIEHKPASLTPPKVPPARPTTSAPARAKSLASAEKILPVSESNSSVKTTDSRKPSQPVASRNQRQSSELPPLPLRPGPHHPLYHYISRQPHGIARHDYTATQRDELSFSEGDTVILVREIDEHWMVGRLGDSEGIFPAAFVDVRCPLSKEKPKSSLSGFDSWSVPDSKAREPDILTGPRCKARFDFEGDGEGELALEDGDVVQIVDRVGTEWLRGQHRGRQGIFPSSFVEVLEDLPPDSSTYGQELSNRVSALFDFDGKDGELIFKAGDQITVLGEVNPDWLFGACHGQEGQFPASFVSHVPLDLPKHKPDQAAHKPDQAAHKPSQSAHKPSQSSHETKLPPQSEPAQNARIHKDSLIPGDEFWESREDVLGFCRAIFDYVDASPGDLVFRKGDRIEIVEFFGEDWARGRLGQKEGMFPLKFVAEEVNSPPKTPEPEVVEKVFGKVLHAFDGETPDDLMIKEGDIIEVEDFADVNKHWRWGVLEGKRGMFPAEFVELLP